MDAYEELLERLKNIDLISQIGGLLGWDQEVLMPPKAAALRAEQLAWVSKTGHEATTDPRIGELLTELEAREDLNDVQSANVRLARDSYNKATKLPTEFVEEMAKHKSQSLISWQRLEQRTISQYSEMILRRWLIWLDRKPTIWAMKSFATMPYWTFMNQASVCRE